MFRVFTTQVTDAVDAAQRFKHLKLSWRKGVHKDKKGVFGIHDVGYEGGYGPATGEIDGLIYQATRNPEIAKIYLDHMRTPHPLRIPVKLRCGIILEIMPAQGEPQEFLFFKTETEQSADPISRITDYGKAAWALIDLQDRGNEASEPVYKNDPVIINLALKALSASYTLPAPVWDAMGFLTLDDIDDIATAALGVGQDFTEAAGKPTGTPVCGEAKAV